MSQAETKQVTTYAEEIAGKDPEAALKIVIAHTEALQAEAARAATEHQSMASVTFGADGLEASSLAGLWRLATLYSKSNLVPTHFRGEPEDCLIGLQLAQRLGVDPFMLFQNLYVVHGKPGIEAKLAIALVNASGKIKGSLTYYLDGEGADRFCRATVLEAETGKEIEYIVERKLAKRMGWDKPGKGGMESQWVTNPDLMLRYRAAMFLIRTHYPEVIMGLQSREELVDTYGEQRQAVGVDLAKRATRSSLNDDLKPQGPSVADTAEKPAPPDGPTGDPHPEVAADAAKNMEEHTPKPAEDDTGAWKDAVRAQFEDAKTLKDAKGVHAINVQLGFPTPDCEFWLASLLAETETRIRESKPGTQKTLPR